MVIDELVTILGVDVAASALPNITRFNRTLDSVNRYVAGVTGAVAAAGAAVTAFVVKMTDSASDLDKFSQLTGMSVEGVQKWGYAFEQAGGSARSARSDIMMMTKALNPIMPGDYNQGLALMFGSKLHDFKNAQQVLLSIAEVFQGMDATKQLQWSSMIGLSEDFTLLAQQGPKAIQGYFSKISAEGALLNKSQTEQARKAEREFRNFQTVLYKTGEVINAKLLPHVTRVLEAFDKWLIKNQAFISSGIDRFVRGVSDGFNTFADGIKLVYRSVTEALPGVGKFMAALIDPRIIGGTVAAALTGITVVLGIMAAKYVLIAAGAMAAAVAVIDFAETLKGKDSIFRRIWEAGKTLVDPSWTADYPTFNPLDWWHQKGAAAMDRLHGEGATGGKSKSVEMIEGFRAMFSSAMTGGPAMISPIAPTAPSSSTGSGGGRIVEVNQPVYINAMDRDPYPIAQEVVRQTERLSGAKFGVDNQ